MSGKHPKDPAWNSKVKEKIVKEVKAQGVFDELRSDLISEMQTTPGYKNLEQKVNDSTKAFLGGLKWNRKMNKKKIREELKQHLMNSSILDFGVDQLVNQTVDSNSATLIQPKVDEIAKKVLAKEEAKRNKEKPEPADNFETFKNNNSDSNQSTVEFNASKFLISEEEEIESPMFSPIKRISKLDDVKTAAYSTLRQNRDLADLQSTAYSPLTKNRDLTSNNEPKMFDPFSMLAADDQPSCSFAATGATHKFPKAKFLSDYSKEKEPAFEETYRKFGFLMLEDEKSKFVVQQQDSAVPIDGTKQQDNILFQRKTKHASTSAHGKGGSALLGAVGKHPITASATRRSTTSKSPEKYTNASLASGNDENANATNVQMKRKLSKKGLSKKESPKTSP